MCGHVGCMWKGQYEKSSDFVIAKIEHVEVVKNARKKDLFFFYSLPHL